MIEKLKRHWFISVLLVCVAVAGTTWKVATEILVYPRDFQINLLQEENRQLKEQLASKTHGVDESPLVLTETGVFEGASITTSDGRCTVRITSADVSKISLSVIVNSNDPIMFKGRLPGDRIAVDGGDFVYYIDLHRVRGNIVDLEVYRQFK